MSWGSSQAEGASPGDRRPPPRRGPSRGCSDFGVSAQASRPGSPRERCWHEAVRAAGVGGQLLLRLVRGGGPRPHTAWGRGPWWPLPRSPGGSPKGLCPRGSQAGTASRTDEKTWQGGRPSEPRGRGISRSRRVSWLWGPGAPRVGGRWWEWLGVGVVHSAPNCPPGPPALGPACRLSAGAHTW